MTKRFVILGVVLLACYLAFGNQILASQTSTPESFFNGLGRGVGDVISGVANQIGQMFWG